MKKHKLGFTLIEVALFLVVTGALFISVTVGVQNSIYLQRFTDSVQSYADFLRTAYSETTNVQGIGSGRSEKAIYGKLITFGERYDSNGDEVNTDNTRNIIFSYDVVGDVGEFGTGNVLDALAALNANVTIVEGNMVRLAGIAQSYSPKWAAAIENTDNFDLFVGAILIVRHPTSGTVHTFIKKGSTIEINQMVSNITNEYATALQHRDNATTEAERAAAINTITNITRGASSSNVLRTSLTDGSFRIQQVDFCINPIPEGRTPLRRDVRIAAGARNSSGVEVINDNDNDCNNI